ncbi:MAG: 1-aminocyclopropane-1-carboxylate deaminase/D-cysteine desulfhydrase, partial [Nitrososphaerales archaeon]
MELLEALGRESLVLGPTPLVEDERLACALGLDRRLFVKRDDLTGPALGGNKVRKLEYLLADASAAGADCLVTVGAAQSNHARLTAVLGTASGFEVHLVLGGDAPDEFEGNLLLDELAGVALHFAGTEQWDALGDQVDATVKNLESEGRKPYTIPLGGSTVIGALGYVRCYLELSNQLAEAKVGADWVVHASSTGGTQAGLLAGRALLGGGPRVYGVDVSKGVVELQKSVQDLANATLGHLGVRASIDNEDILTSDFAGPGYGAVTEEAARALKTALRASGILTDP